jgi:hypothetical protein
MSSSDGYEALQRGILDCSPIDPVLAHGWKYDETVINLPKDEFAKLVDFPAVKAVREKWIKRANAHGVPAGKIAEELSFRPHPTGA